MPDFRDVAYKIATAHLTTQSFTFDEYCKVDITDHCWQPLEDLPFEIYDQLITQLATDIEYQLITAYNQGKDFLTERSH